ncbi:enoyl-CoA hydratase-related protein [Ferrimicrobium acidiphilum]|uniref:Enoyl-CoA hydratase domain-containing protein 3, mitochondrial n=1 Tax=Ferrimicrobium acidiphilum DSM 19497 TaxID=1121877 RepID=A0A0D8FYW5_9ACTN|nr:enoyl-CoA hydratase-related protein [Ferrimicrobium acidiphilum]KJE77982.1 methylmalonyl-CoA decarboxylase [Ferrimicrobium acidiphilum DSM 19497]MCL5054112.1 enoyl-CoA hydratase-related protein [Gammaproteobacteria bacterium]
MASYRYVQVHSDRDFTVITMDRPAKRNALSLAHMEELLDAFTEAGKSEVRGIILAANGPVFSAGHDFSEMAGQDYAYMDRLLHTCTRLMLTIADLAQPVIARVNGLATAAGAQLVASCDLAVASSSAGFAAPGGKGGWFCHTPMVAIGHSIGRKRAAEMAMTGDTIDAFTALSWGLINRVVEQDQLDEATMDLLERATRGSRYSKALGKHSLYNQLDLPIADAYSVAIAAMAGASQTHDAQEGMAAFLEKRAPEWTDH